MIDLKKKNNIQHISLLSFGTENTKKGVKSGPVFHTGSCGSPVKCL